MQLYISAAVKLNHLPLIRSTDTAWMTYNLNFFPYFYKCCSWIVYQWNMLSPDRCSMWQIGWFFLLSCVLLLEGKKKSVYLFNSGSWHCAQKQPLCLTFWTPKEPLTWRQSSETSDIIGVINAMFLSKLSLFGRCKREYEGIYSDAMVRRFWWLWMSSGLSLGHDEDNVTMTSLSGNCGNNSEKHVAQEWSYRCLQVFTTKQKPQTGVESRANEFMKCYFFRKLAVVCCCLAEKYLIMRHVFTCGNKEWKRWWKAMKGATNSLAALSFWYCLFYFKNISGYFSLYSIGQCKERHEMWVESEGNDMHPWVHKTKKFRIRKYFTQNYSE